MKLAMQLSRRAQRSGIAEQKQITHHLFEHPRFTRTQAIHVQVTLVLQFTQRFFFQHSTDFAGFPMQDSKVRVWAVQSGIYQISHESHLLDGFQ
jgi:hypothetical protein